MVDIITTCILIFGFGSTIIGLKYLLFKCDSIVENQFEFIIEDENILDEEPPPKYEDIVE